VLSPLERLLTLSKNVQNATLNSMARPKAVAEPKVASKKEKEK